MLAGGQKVLCSSDVHTQQAAGSDSQRRSAVARGTAAALDDEEMVLPHQPEFSYRQHIVLGTAIACGFVAALQTDLSVPMRIASPFIALWVVGLGFLVGWFPLKVQALLWSRLLPGLIRGLCLFVFYFFSVGSMVNLLAFPLLAEDLKTEGISFSQFILMLPAGIGATAGAHRVFTKHVV
jgi:hypothetical protein